MASVFQFVACVAAAAACVFGPAEAGGKKKSGPAVVVAQPVAVPVIQAAPIAPLATKKGFNQPMGWGQGYGQPMGWGQPLGYGGAMPYGAYYRRSKKY